MFQAKLPASRANKVTILGDFLHYGEGFIDFRLEGTESEVQSLCNKVDLLEEGTSDVLMSMINEAMWVDGAVCASNETEWDKALASDDPYVRALVALNGKHLETAIKDSSKIVRRAAATYFDDCVAYNLPYNNVEMLTPLLYDDDFVVRVVMARLGDETLNDRLVKDRDINVRMTLASYAGDKHLEILRCDDSEEVRSVIAKKGRFATSFASDNSAKVRMSVAAHATFNDIAKTELLTDENAMVRYYLAARGFYNDVLVNDKNPKVRLTAREVSQKLQSQT